MQITCKVNQPEAIRRGFNTNSTVKLEVDVTALTESQRAVLGEYFTDGDFRPQLPQPDLAGLVEKLDAISARRAEEQRAEEQKKARDVAREAERLQQIVDDLRERKTEKRKSRIYASGRAKDVDYSWDSSPHDEETDRCKQAITLVPGGAEWLAGLDAKFQAAKAAAEAQVRANVAAVAAEDRAEAEKEAAINEFKHNWIQRHGTNNQRARLKAGLLSDEEIVQSISDSAFAVTAADRYTEPDVECTCDYPECCTVKFTSGTEDTATAEQWDFVDQIRKQLPENATLKLRWHRAAREACGQTETRHSIRAVVLTGPMEVQRDFAV
jgi:hypothetical protein